MVTTRISIDNYLAEYLIGKWGVNDKDDNFTGVVEIPSNVYLYNLLHSLTTKRPIHVKETIGNLEIVLPHRRDGNKNPRYYNFICEKSAIIFNKKVKLFFRSELHEFIDHMKHDQGLTYKESCFLFLAQYEIESLDVDTIIKDYARWKSNVRIKRKKAFSTK